MRLTDLEGRLVAHTSTGFRDVDSLAEAQGVTFLCPCGEGHSVGVWFRDRGVPDDATPGPGRWVVDPSSHDLATLTLTPSIALRCWHGFVTRGEAR